jgi:uncharacterized protein VirK/YbjX
VLRKPLVEYAIGGLSRRARLEMLLAHYELFAARFHFNFVQDVCSGRKIPLTRLVSKGHVYEIWVGSSDQVSTTGEGEIVFAMTRAETGQDVCKLTIFFSSDESEPILVIGGVRSSPGFKSIVTTATRKLDGLRPKDALLLASRSFAAATGFREVHAICNDRHVEKHGGRLLANFDDYWIERGAKSGGPFGFVLAAKPPAVDGQTGRDCLKRQIVDDVAKAASRFLSTDIRAPKKHPEMV